MSRTAMTRAFTPFLTEQADRRANATGQAVQLAIKGLNEDHRIDGVAAATTDLVSRLDFRALRRVGSDHPVQEVLSRYADAFSAWDGRDVPVAALRHLERGADALSAASANTRVKVTGHAQDGSGKVKLSVATSSKDGMDERPAGSRTQAILSMFASLKGSGWDVPPPSP